MDDEHINARRRDAIATTETIEHAVTTLLSDRQTFSRFRDAVNGATAVRQTHFPGAVARWYSQSVLLGLRRLRDPDRRTHSMRTLFDRMIAHPGDWSLQSVVQIWDSTGHNYEPEFLAMLARSTYRPFADESGERLDFAKVATHRAELEEALSAVRAVVDKTVAHVERHDDEPPAMTFDQIDDAINFCHELAKPYIALLTGRGYSDMTPTEQVAWWRIFQSWSDMPPFPTGP